MSGGFDFAGLLPLVLIFVVMYFLIIRPQSKKAKKHQEMIRTLKKGDRVVTNGGIIGTVSKVLDTELVLEIAKDVEVHVSRPMVTSLIDPKALAKASETQAANKTASKVKAVKK